MNIVDFAYQVIDLNNRVIELEKQNEDLMYYKDKYFELLNSSIAHGEKMTGQLLQVMMTPGVVEACAAAAEKAES